MAVSSVHDDLRRRRHRHCCTSYGSRSPVEFLVCASGPRLNNLAVFFRASRTAQFRLCGSDSADFR
jgi:hypothetical protein